MSEKEIQQPVVREAPALYRPRYPERTIFYQLVRDHFDQFALVHEERFEASDGPLRPEGRKVVNQFLDCGLLENGFARVRCPRCKAEFFCAFSCQVRGFCNSCQQKRAVLFAEKLREEILAPVHHRHFIFTIPVALRQLFLRERRLLGILPRCASLTVKRCFQAVLCQEDGLPGMVAAIQTFGSQIEFNPHLHCLVSDGVFLPGGEFVPLPLYDEEFERLLTETFRRLVLDELVKANRLSLSFREKLLSWQHGGGFSVFGRHQHLGRVLLVSRRVGLRPDRAGAVCVPVRVDALPPSDESRAKQATRLLSTLRRGRQRVGDGSDHGGLRQHAAAPQGAERLKGGAHSAPWAKWETGIAPLTTFFFSLGEKPQRIHILHYQHEVNYLDEVLRMTRKLKKARRAERAILAVLPHSVRTHVAQRDSGSDFMIGDRPLQIQWVGEGRLGDVNRLLAGERNRPDVVVARRLSPGAREALSDAGVGWVDETGAAEIVLGPIVVSRTGHPTRPSERSKRWTPSVFAIAEALLCGTRGTVAATQEATGLSTGSCTNALAFLTDQGLLAADAERGRRSARQVIDRDQLLDSYASEVEATPEPIRLQVGVVWRDLVAGLLEQGNRWNAADMVWASTGAAAASVIAPHLTTIGSIEVYIEASTIPELEAVASDSGLRPMEGGRLTLLPFPTVAVQQLAEEIDGLRVAPWPRVYADLRNSGVRGEEAAEHLREVVIA